MSLFDQSFCAKNNGVLKFDYVHEDRSTRTLYMSCTRRMVRYSPLLGSTSDWHGEVTERGQLGLSLADDKAYCNNE